MRLQDEMPAWICNMTKSALGISGTITALGVLADNADTEAAAATYTSYAARLASWVETIPGVSSTAVLAPIIPLT